MIILYFFGKVCYDYKYVSLKEIKNKIKLGLYFSLLEEGAGKIPMPQATPS